MRARGIKPDFFTDEDIVELTPWARLLFIGLWCMADRAGRMTDKPKQFKIKLFPCDSVDVETLLEELLNHGFIVRYMVGEARYIQVKNFEKHQSPHAKEAPSTLPAPGEHRASTVLAPDKHRASTGRAALTVDTDTDTDTDTLPVSPDDVFYHWKKVMNKNSATHFDDKRKRAVKWALKTYGFEGCCAAIDGYANSDWHMGRDPQTGGKQFNNLTLIFRDAEHAEKFMTKPPSVLDEIDRIWGGDNGD